MGNFQVQAPGGLYLEGRLNGGFFASRFWGAYIWKSLYLEGLIFGILRYVHTIPDIFSWCSHANFPFPLHPSVYPSPCHPSSLFQLLSWTATARNWDKSVDKQWTSCRCRWPSRVWWTKCQSSFLNIYFVSVDSGPRSYLFTSATVLIPVYPTPKYGTEAGVKLHFKARRGSALLCCRNRAKINVLASEQKLYPVWFSCRRKSYPV